MLFSGRTNPQWQLTAADAEKFLASWANAPLSATHVKIPSLPGYTGCRIIKDHSCYWLIYGGIITQFNAHAMTSRVDINHETEKWLLHTAPKEIASLLKKSKQA